MMGPLAEMLSKLDDSDADEVVGFRDFLAARKELRDVRAKIAELRKLELELRDWMKQYLEDASKPETPHHQAGATGEPGNSPAPPQ